MDIDELLLILEKSRDKIQPLDEDFYDKLKKRVKELEELRRRIEDEREVLRIEDELRTLKRIQRKIFEARTSKIIRAAWAKICETESGIDGFENLIKSERDLFRKLIEVISEFKKSVLEELEKEESKDESSDYVLVRVKSDIPEFEGVDGKTYKLRREDVVTLPALNANALIKGDVVEIIRVMK
jgi:DNA replication factor GINS